MFQVLEKGGKLQPVHSKADLDYMTRNGWRVAPAVAPVAPAVAPDAPKRKYTRRAK